MDKKEFKSKSIVERIEYINSEMKKGKSYSAICRELGISKGSLGTTLKNHGYKLIDNQYVLTQIEGQGSLFTNNVGEDKQEMNVIDVQSDRQIDTEKGENMESNIIRPLQNEPLKKENKRNVGRPQKHEKDGQGNKINKSKMTIEIDNKVITALRLKKTLEKISINDFVEDLLSKNIEEKYFKMIEE